MKNNLNENQFKKKLLGYLTYAGTRNLKISNKQEMKLREWILPSLNDEHELSSAPLPISDIRKFIDEWENSDLNKSSYEYYYVIKRSEGKNFFWDNYLKILFVALFISVIWKFF
jgi:hypothetical protein